MQIEDYIGRGRQAAVSRRELVNSTHFSDRLIRRLIRDARRRGVMICSDGDRGGYYIADTPEERAQLMRQYMAYIRDMLDTYKAMAGTPIEGQEELDEQV